jgi:glycosyltransferase involved in cell wall biosynthesis
VRDLRAVVAIPAKNEAALLGGCLEALAAARAGRVDDAVICLNNCNDGSAGFLSRVAPDLPFAVHVLDVVLPPDRACAGVARRLAMDRAAVLAGPRGVVLTTDADGRVAPDWLAVNLAAIRAGADAVAGRAEIEPEGAALIPPHLHALDARECAYAALLDEIAALVDPDPHDPWPRHDEHSGASIAVTVAAYRRAGGLPPVRLAEDRAFFDALRRVDAKIRHDPAARVVVSARIDGRAAGGMADTIRRRIDGVDAFLDPRLEPVVDHLRRVRLRAGVRRVWERQVKTGGLGGTARLPQPFFGEAWDVVERDDPRLRRRLVALADLPRETARARRLRDWLLRAAADRADTGLRDAAD